MTGAHSDAAMLTEAVNRFALHTFLKELNTHAESIQLAPTQSSEAKFDSRLQ
jgi:hypothetical protein